jgi:hypothetical protein
MKYTVGIDSGAMIYIPSSIKFVSAIQKLIRGIHRHTDSMDRTSLISLLKKRNV